MKKFLLAILLYAHAALAAAGGPEPVKPENLQWIRPPAIPGLQFAWVLGAENQPGPYVLRVKLAPGTRIMPHTHPDSRITTVLCGTLYVGFVETLDETEAVAIPPRAVYVTPANTPHFVMAKDEDAVYQESGTGPTGTTPVNH
jgi:quercetin dioxygenase-like cupin family protein